MSEIIDLGRPAATILAQTWDFLTTWISDSRHNSNTLDKALQQAFDPARWLFGPAALLVSGIHVALAASQVDNNSLLGLFCNYRGASYARMQSAYKLFLPEEREPLL
ncbi:hypothetical protein Asppvi_003805 [Aspergillus pseudoviridinutans]|uniref:Uncharacterized protein n=1 Tax=Aspergillus pseudoviridinutans TaxID=1517512 RepID=A0A9P3B6L9_9EURO|nr:uncharacterized protein Asppvi_003805 [Aspergillus pseudoviridinutans]GIJ84950.1 hypothetical protein Asppvi_003805 [Aspergillus pseudoviridinutans]